MNDTPTPTYERMIITPELAAEWLRRNTHNRRVEPDRYKEMARDITNGRWYENGNAVRFDWNNVLVDGQHTLNAIVFAGRPITHLVVRNLDPASQDTMDSGRKRTAGDMWALAGYQHTNNLASAINRLWRWDNGDRFLTGSRGPTRGEQRQYLDANPSVMRSVERGVYIRGHFRPITPTNAAVSHFLCSRVDTDTAVWFFQRLADGEDLKTGDPIKALRRRLTNDAMDKVKSSPGRDLTYVISAWNAHREGRPLQNVLHNSGSPIPEPK